MALNPKLPPVDVDTPNAARMYDYHLGGSHNFAADREAAERTREAMPWVRDAIWANRSFLRRAVLHCHELGIDQFLDLGSGIPTVGNVHEVAQQVNPQARVAYVDNEPVAVITCETLLAEDPLTTVTHEDLRRVDAVLAAPGVADLIDFSRPVALLTVSVLHFLTDADDPAGVAARFRARLGSGSVHALSHFSGDNDPAGAAAGSASYRKTSNPTHIRTRDEIAAMLAGTELVEPGLVDANDWRPDDATPQGRSGYYAAMGRIS